MVLGFCVGHHPVQAQLIEGMANQQPDRPCRHAQTPVIGQHCPGHLAAACAQLPDLDGSGQLTLMLDEEDDGVVLGGFAASQRHVAVLQVRLKGNTHASTLDQSSAYVPVMAFHRGCGVWQGYPPGGVERL